MATGVKEQAITFAARQIKKNPDISMSELRTRASKKKINIYPLIMGLAKTRLGLGRNKAGRRRGRGGRRRRPGRPFGRRGPGRPRVRQRLGRPRRLSSDPTAALRNVVSHVRDLEREVSALRSALAKIADIASGG
jgi:hypothetical protein